MNVLNYPVLWAVFPLTTSILDAAREALRLAKSDGCAVEFDFNGHELRVLPTDRMEWIVSRYHRDTGGTK